jgi:ketosteroid isomerase-like protein
MKRCPTCQRTYADDTLRFCLEDGTALAAVSVSSADQTLLMNSAAESSEPPPTEILDFGAAPTVRAYDEDATARRSQPAQTASQQARPTINEFQNQVAPAPRNTTSVVAVTAVATILVLAVGGLGAWLLLRDKSGNGSSAANTGTDSVRVSNSSNAATPNINTSGSTSANTGTLPGTVSTPVTLATPSATPLATPQPTPQNPTDTSNARRDVMNALNGWTETMRRADLDGHMAYYADTLHTYYMQSNYSASRVRANVAKAFSKYATFDVKLSNIQIEVDASGASAVATFDKTFVFSGATTYSGSGLNRFWLEKIGGRWLITGEKDLKTYYVNND